MMNSRTGQQSSSGYVAGGQADLSSLQPGQDHHAHIPEPPDDANSVSSIYQGVNNADELPTRHHPRTALDGSTRSVSRTSHHSHKEPQIDVKESPAIPQPKNEWRSWKLSWWFNITVLLTEIGFIVAIVVVDWLSARNGGIVTVPNIESSSSILSLLVTSKIRQYYGLLWASLPSLIFTLYSLT
jgi:hypothetical protein